MNVKSKSKAPAAALVISIVLSVLLLSGNGLAALQPVAPTTWYLAEGTTGWGFSTYITIANPNDERLTAQVTYMDPNGTRGKGKVAGRRVALPPMSQTTVDPRWDLKDTDFSTKVTCVEGKPIAVDRTMFWTGEGAKSPEGHNSVGVNAPSKTWYLPEGSSNNSFETWTLLLNPNNSEARVTLTYMTEDAGPKVAEKKIPAYSRASYSMEGDIGKADASIEVKGNVPVIAERSMYRHNKREGSCSIGTTKPSNNFYLAEGSTAHGFTTYVLVQNPGDKPAEITMWYMTPKGPKEQPHFTMDPNSRKTIKVNKALSNSDCSIQVFSKEPIIAERSMYWDSGEGEAMHDSIGVPEAHKSFLLPDGQTSKGYETYTCVQNPGEIDVSIEVTYLPQGGGRPVSFTDTVPSNSRRTYNMADKVKNGRASTMVTVKGGVGDVIAERSMYWNNKGAGTCSIGGYSYPQPQVNHTITASAGAGGSISPAGAVVVKDGSSQSFTIAPSAHYRLADVLVDGATVGAVTTYTFSNVKADHTIAAVFAPITHTITAWVEEIGPLGGSISPSASALLISISPSGAVVVNDGADQAFTITGHFFKVEVDGVDVGQVTSYTFTNVTSDHTIKVVPAFS